MRRVILMAALMIPLLSAPLAARAEAGSESPAALTAAGPESLFNVHAILFYAPNRLLDLLDVVRLRVRLGPGYAGGLRATKFARVFLGSYTGIYVGLPGPRGGALPSWPAGLESRVGAGVSVADATLGGPHYGSAEIGGEFQAAFLGLNLGIAPLEVLDLAAGLLLTDLRDDDF